MSDFLSRDLYVQLRMLEQNFCLNNNNKKKLKYLYLAFC